MEHIQPEQIKKLLSDSIYSIEEHRDKFFVDPKADFTRKKLISLEDTILFTMTTTNDNLSSEILDFFPENNLPTKSALVQQRSKIKPEAFSFLFQDFSAKIPVTNKFKELRLVAGDGSRLNTPYNPSDKDSFCTPFNNKKGFNQYHLNTFFDPLNRIFIDGLVQGACSMDEQAACCAMVDRYHGEDFGSVFLLDRGYDSFNVISHIHNRKQFFLIRFTSSFAKNLAAKTPGLLDGTEVDKIITIHVGRRRTKKNLALENYHYIPKKRRYDFIDAESDHVDHFLIRVLKFPLSDDSYEYIVTNLLDDKFPLEDIKSLYNLRWEIMPISG